MLLTVALMALTCAIILTATVHTKYYFYKIKSERYIYMRDTFKYAPHFKKIQI